MMVHNKLQVNYTNERVVKHSKDQNKFTEKYSILA